MMTPGSSPRLGELLTRSGLVSSEDLAQALTRQTVTYLRLGELLVAAGVIEEAVLRAVLAVQDDLQFGRDRDPAETVCRRLGAIFANRVAVPRETLERALEEHAKGDVSLNEVLARIGVGKPD